MYRQPRVYEAVESYKTVPVTGRRRRTLVCTFYAWISTTDFSDYDGLAICLVPAVIVTASIVTYIDTIACALRPKNKSKDLFIVVFSKIVNISARVIFRHQMMCMYRWEWFHTLSNDSMNVTYIYIYTADKWHTLCITKFDLPRRSPLLS